MSQLSVAIHDITNWTGKAFSKLNTFIKAKDTENAVLLAADIQTVVNGYFDVVNQYIPIKPVTPMPSNFFKQLAWLGKNIQWLQVLLTLLTGTDPFINAKANAQAIALKWGF